jgi:hypothetical protein
VSIPPTTIINDQPPFQAHPPQTHADPSEPDAVTLRIMLARLYAQISKATGTPAQLPSTLYLPEPDGRQHRVVVLNEGALRIGGQLPFVGFFGRKRASVDADMLDTLDAELIEELRHNPHMLSYSSLELPDGSWGNLVIMRSPQGAVDWASSARHAHAAYTIAPACYLTIRLHSGVLILNGPPHGELQIRRTKHFDYAWGNC